MKKKCGKCGEVKPLIEFHKNATSALGRASSCKKCKKEYNKQHHLENREPRLAIGRKYYEENKDKVSKRKQKYYKENRELWQQQQKQYYQENREKVLARQIAHNKGKKAEKKEYDKQYREDTKDKRNKWYRDKYQNDIEYRLHHLIKAGIHKALKRNCDEQGEATDQETRAVMGDRLWTGPPARRRRCPCCWCTTTGSLQSSPGRRRKTRAP